MRYTQIGGLFMLAWLSWPVLANTCQVSSGATQRALIEMYTSEGCSSCPPADQWLSRINNTDKSAGQVERLAFHVDYWDYIGWKDRFAQPAFAERQRALVRYDFSSIVYTPQIFINGQDYRAWTNAPRWQEKLTAINQAPAKAEIQMALEETAANAVKLALTFKTQAPEPLDYYVALTENNLKTAVKAGENRDVNLRHDAVVRQWLGPFKLAAGKTQVNHPFKLASDWKKADLRWVVLVQNKDNGDVLQTLGLPLCAVQ